MSEPTPSPAVPSPVQAVRRDVVKFAATRGTAYLDIEALRLVTHYALAPDDVLAAVARAAIAATDEARDALVLGHLPDLAATLTADPTSPAAPAAGGQDPQ